MGSHLKSDDRSTPPPMARLRTAEPPGKEATFPTNPPSSPADVAPPSPDHDREVLPLDHVPLRDDRDSREEGLRSVRAARLGVHEVDDDPAARPVAAVAV